MRCHSCYGSGKVMGGGMISKTCDACEGIGSIDLDRKEYEEQEFLNKPSVKPEIIIKRSRKRLIREQE